MIRDLIAALEYSPDTGLFTWRRCAKDGVLPGTKAGHISKDGYVVVRFQGRLIRAHRLAWFMTHGGWPTACIDHINGERADNRLCNLREATVAENNKNRRRARRDAKAGLLGVTWHKASLKWVAQITRNRQTRYLGQFDTAEAAHAAYLEARSQCD